MHTTEELQKIFADALAEQQIIKKPEGLYEPIEYILSLGGKRMRPVLLMMAYEMFGGNAVEALNEAMAIEVFHNFTLLHDDIMDKSPVRRGKETVHMKWDENRAILSGDTMMVMAYEYLTKNADHLNPEILRVFNNTAKEVCEGQQYDMEFETRTDVKLEEYMEMIRLKTSVLLAGSLQIGALLAKASKKDQENIYKYGERIGLAFQLMDDLLDVYGDFEKFGKKSGNDIVTNKKTYLYILAFNTADSSTSAKLTEAFSIEDPVKKVDAVKELYGQLDIKNKTIEKIEALNSEGLEFLDMVNVNLQLKKELISFADKLKVRDH